MCSMRLEKEWAESTSCGKSQKHELVLHYYIIALLHYYTIPIPIPIPITIAFTLTFIFFICTFTFICITRTVLFGVLSWKKGRAE